MRLLTLFLVALTFSLNMLAQVKEGGVYYRCYNAGDGTGWAEVIPVPMNLADEYKGDIVISDSVTYKGRKYKVAEIGFCAFSSCDELTSVVIPESVKEIDSRAFYHCSQLTKVNLPAALTQLKVEAFSGCYNLKTITIPPNLKLIETKAFSDCTALTTVIIPKTVNRIGEAAFRDCFGLTTLIIEDGVESIFPYAFAGCHSLTTVALPSSLNFVGDNAFQACQNVTDVTVPNRKIRKDAFNSCPHLTNVTYCRDKTAVLHKGYRGIVSVGVGPGAGGTSYSKVAVYTTQGYQFSPYYYLGIGVGYYGRIGRYTKDEDKHRDSFDDIKAFLDTRFTLKKKHTPFLSLKAGCAAFSNQNWYFSPSVGYRMGLNQLYGLNVSVALDCAQMTDYSVADKVRYQKHPHYWEKNLTFNIAFDF